MSFRLSAAALPLGALITCIALPGTALAQEDAPDIDIEETAFDGDFVSAGIGAAVGPSYEGSDDYVVYPAPAVIGRLGGVNFQTRGPGLAADFWVDDPDAKFGFVLGPVARLRFDRSDLDGIDDPVVERLGELDIAVELGGTIGFQVSDLITGYDTLSVFTDVKWDVAGAHDGMVIAPQIAYFTPVSRGVAVTAALSADFVDGDFADYYYSVDAAGAAASGLPVFDADGGLKNVSLFVLTGIDLNGNLADGGWGVFVAGSYSRLVGDFEDSPIVAVRGDKDQFVGLLGVGYTF